MEMERKDINLQIGKRLREARINLNRKKPEFAETLDLTEEHYRKLEAGKTRISADKLFILHEKYGIDPTYLITGICSTKADFNLDSFVANSTKEDRDNFFERVLAYVVRLIK